MSTQETTSTAERATRREVFRFVANSQLPLPQEMSVSANGVVFLSFDTYDEIEVWAEHLNAERYTDRRPEGVKLYSYFPFRDLLGFHGVLTCHEDAPVAPAPERTIFSHCNWIGGCDTELTDRDGSMLCPVHAAAPLEEAMGYYVPEHGEAVAR